MNSGEIDKLLEESKSDEEKKQLAFGYCQDKEHAWCQYTKYMRWFYFLLLENHHLSADKEIMAFRSSIDNQLNNCFNCIIKYHREKKISRDMALAKYTQESVRELFKLFNQIDQQRIIARLSNYLGNDEPRDRILCTLHEIFHYPEVLENKELYNYFSKALNIITRDYQINFQNGIKVPGLYILLFSDQVPIREWVLSALVDIGKINGMDQIGILHPIIERIIKTIESHQLSTPFSTYFTSNEDEFWSGLELLFIQIEPNIFRNGIIEFHKGFIEMILNVLKIKPKGSISIGYLKCLSVLFDFLQHDFWSYTNQKPNLIVQDLCDLIITSKKEDVQQQAIKLMNQITSNDITEDVTLKQFVIEFCLKRCAYPSTNFTMNTKNKAFELVLDIMIYCFEEGLQVPSVEGWGDRLVYYCTFQNHLSLTPQMKYVTKCVTVLSKVMLIAAHSLRSRFQLLYHGTPELRDNAVKSPCTFWYSRLWEVLFASQPKIIPFSIHETIFKVHRILSLLSVPSGYQENASKPLFNCLSNYQNSLCKYIKSLTNVTPFIIPKVLTDSLIQMDVLESEDFTKSIFSFTITANSSVRDAFKELLIQKYKDTKQEKHTITNSLKNAVKLFPHQCLKGVVGTLRDIVYFIGIYNCETISIFFYYINHIIHQLKNQLDDFHTRKFMPLITDSLWPMIELILKETQIYTIKDVKPIFQLFVDSFSIFSFVRYTNIQSPPSFILNYKRQSKHLFETTDQYPRYLREQLEDMVEISESSNFNDDIFKIFDFLFEDLKYQYDNEHDGDEFNLDLPDENLFTSIIANQKEWIEKFLYWGSNQIDTDWFQSFAVILRDICKQQLILSTPLKDFCKSLIGNPSKLSNDQLTVLKKYYSKLDPSSQQIQTTTAKPSASVQKPIQVHNPAAIPQHREFKKDDCPLGFNCPKIRNPEHVMRFRHGGNNNNNNNNNNSSLAQRQGVINNNSASFGTSSSIKSSKAYDFSNTFDPFDQPLTRPISAADKKKTKLLDIGGSSSVFLKKQERNRIALMEAHLPKVENLHKILLSWTTSTLNEVDDQLKVIPTSFENLTEYIQIFEPLLLQEFKGQLLKAVEEMETSSTTYILDDIVREGEFHLVHFFVDGADEDLMVDDLVLLQRDIKDVKCEAFGKVEGKGRKERKDKNFIRASYISIRFYQLEKKRINLVPFMKTNSPWNIQKLSSLSTVNREYLALHLVGKIPLGSYIISPSLAISSPSNNGVNVPSGLQSKLSTQLNQSQLDAITHSLTPHGFTLLQGPPGTGKTKTIMALLSVFLNTPLDSKLNSTTPPKILVCAPSNAAVDEIASRIIDGNVLDKDGNPYIPSAIRIGHPSVISKKVQQISLDCLLEKNQNDPKNSLNNEQTKINSAKEKLSNVSTEYDQVVTKISELSKNLKSSTGDQDITRDLTNLYHKKDKLRNDLKLAKDGERRAIENSETAKKNMVLTMLNNCSIILSTLSGSGQETLSLAIKKFDVVIIDEAAQAVELSTLIPLKHDVKKCVLVGDPNQLPPTIISKMASQYQYETSLFQRLSSCGVPQQILKVQYRMHPIISKFPSRHFYMNVLEDGPNVQQYKEEFYKDPRFGPFIFYDIFDSSEESGPGYSLKNVYEAKLVSIIINSLIINFPNAKGKSIGVITPYKQQVHEITKRLSSFKFDIDVSSVDGFQGREKDIVIFSCVRAHKGGSIGFLSDIRRMNVGLTRARSSLIIIGNSQLLKMNPDWDALVKHSLQIQNGYFPISLKNIDRNLLPMSPESNNVNFVNPNQTRTSSVPDPSKGEIKYKDYGNSSTNKSDSKKNIKLESSHYEEQKKRKHENENDQEKTKKLK